VIKVMQELNL